MMKIKRLTAILTSALLSLSMCCTSMTAFADETEAAADPAVQKAAEESAESDEAQVMEISAASSERAGTQIPVYIILPSDYDETSPYPLVMMLHGHSDNRREYGGFGCSMGERLVLELIAEDLIYCAEEKDRAGFASALLECAVEAAYDKVIAYYMLSYENFYVIEHSSEQYAYLANANIVQFLKDAFDTENPQEGDLEEDARNYFLSVGLTDDEISSLCDRRSAVRETL